LFAVRHRLPDDPECHRRQVAVNVIGRVEIDRVDLVAVHKTVEVDDLRGLDLKVLQLVIGDRDIAPALELVAFDNPITIDNLAGLGSPIGCSHNLYFPETSNDRAPAYPGFALQSWTRLQRMVDGSEARVDRHKRHLSNGISHARLRIARANGAK